MESRQITGYCNFEKRDITITAYFDNTRLLSGRRTCHMYKGSNCSERCGEKHVLQSNCPLLKEAYKISDEFKKQEGSFVHDN